MFLMIFLNTYNLYTNETFCIDNQFSLIHIGIVKLPAPMAIPISAQIEEVPINHNRFRNNTKYRKECVLRHYLELKNVCQTILVYGKNLKGLAWLGHRLQYWKNTTMGYCFRMTTSLLMPCNRYNYLI